MLLSEGQMSDYKGAALMLPAMPKAKELLADKGYDADWFRAALAKRGVAVCIPSKSNRKVAIPYDPSSTSSATRTTEQSAIMNLMLSRSSGAASDLVKTMNTDFFEGPTAQRSTSESRAQANPRL
jgi:hypothetical protein